MSVLSFDGGILFTYSSDIFLKYTDPSILILHQDNPSKHCPGNGEIIYIMQIHTRRSEINTKQMRQLGSFCRCSKRLTERETELNGK